MRPTIRMLQPGDEASLEAFLAHRERADSSLFLRSNVRAAGLSYRGEPHQGVYVGAFDGSSLVAVASHGWNDMILLQAPASASDPETFSSVLHALVARSGRKVSGLSGPYAQVVAARIALGLADAPAAMDARDDLFSLDLAHPARLIVPERLARGELRCIRPRAEHLELVVQWRIAYCVETLGDRETEDMRAGCRRDIERVMAKGTAFVLLESKNEVVAYSGFNAELPDCVQIGGVFVPRPLRGRKYAQAVVAGSLLVARAAGVSRSVLFTNEDNHAACGVYRALGFSIIGDYGLVRFRDPMHAMAPDDRFDA